MAIGVMRIDYVRSLASRDSSHSQMDLDLAIYNKPIHVLLRLRRLSCHGSPHVQCKIYWAGSALDCSPLEYWDRI